MQYHLQLHLFNQLNKQATANTHKISSLASKNKEKTH